MRRHHHPGQSTNDTTVMWRQMHHETQERRDRREPRMIAELARLEREFKIGVVPLSEYHMRVWLPTSPRTRADYWPRTGTVMIHGRREYASSPEALLAMLKREAR